MSSTAIKTITGQTGANAQKKIAVLGCGKMGSILLQAFLERELVSAGEVAATVQHEDKSRNLPRALDGIALGTDNRGAVGKAQTVLLCVKPQALAQVLDEIAAALAPGALVISIAASTTVGFIQEKLGKDVAVVRAMPNTPAMVGAAMTALCAGAAAKAEHLETARRLFESVGRAVVVDEKNMDAITALSASGPAFVFVILESLAEAGVKVGLPREMATTLAAMVMAIGNTAEFVTITTDASRGFHHVFTVVKVGDGRRIVLDPVPGPNTTEMIHSIARYQAWPIEPVRRPSVAGWQPAAIPMGRR